MALDHLIKKCPSIVDKRKEEPSGGIGRGGKFNSSKIEQAGF
jgi:hypothetical protein